MLTHVNTTVLWRYKIKSNLESIPFWVPYKSKKVMLQVGTRYYWLEKKFYHLYFNPKISNFGSNYDSIGLKKKSQNYSTRPDLTVNDSVGSWLEQFPTWSTPSLHTTQAQVTLVKNGFKRCILTRIFQENVFQFHTYVIYYVLLFWNCNNGKVVYKNT